MVKDFYRLERNYTVSMSDMDKRYAIKPASLLNFMQDCASRNLINTPFGNEELNAQGLGWFLVRYRIEFDKYPIGVHDINVFTENRGTMRQSAFRDFIVSDINGNRFLRAATYWLMVDLETKSLVNVEQKFPEITKFQKREDDLQLQKLKSLSDWDLEKSFNVRYEDLDMNGHVNNTVYMTWAMEAVDFEFKKSHPIKAIDIYYKHEAKYGEDIVSCIKADYENCVTEHIIKDAKTQEELCLIKIEYC